MKIESSSRFRSSMRDGLSSTRVEERPREFVSSKKEPNGRDATEVEPFENTSGWLISVVDFCTAEYSTPAQSSCMIVVCEPSPRSPPS